jgi:hypothetical protein
MPEFMAQDDVVFRDERAEDSANNHPVPELSNRDKVLLQRVLVEHEADVPDCWDLSQTHRDVADGLQLDNSVSLINCDNVIIREGIVLKIIEAMKIWLMEYVLFHHRPFIVKHSK